MDCYFHPNVPSIARCADCAKAICATCRDEAGTCPSCRLAAKINASSAERKPVTGEVPPRWQQWWRTTPQQQPVRQTRATVAEVADPPESRALVALGYPLVPLAIISLFDRKQSRRLRKHAYQAIGFNFGMYGLYALLLWIANMPFVNWTPLGWSSEILLAFMLPVFVVLSVYYGIRAWHGEDVRVPIISDWLDDRLPV